MRVDELDIGRLRALWSVAGENGVPAHLGDAASEYRHLRESAGIGPAPPADHLLVKGEDRIRFLQGLTTCDLGPLANAPGRGVYGYFTDRRGKILADALFLALADRLLVRLPPGRAEPIRDHLLAFRIMDRVEIEVLEGLVGVSLLGPRWRRCLEVLSPEPDGAEVWSHDELAIEGETVRRVVEGRLGLPGCTLWSHPPGLETVAKRLLAGPEEIAPVPAGRAAVDAVRIEAGLPIWGLDFDADDLPQEVGEEGTVDFQKGCYLGQEVIARIHYRGRVNRTLVGLRLRLRRFPTPGAELRADEATVGRLGSVVDSPRLGPIGLALVHRKAAARATELTFEGGEARVVELPFTDD